MPKQTTKKKPSKPTIRVNKKIPKKALKKVPPKTKTAINKKPGGRKAIVKPAYNSKREKISIVSSESKKITPINLFIDKPVSIYNRDKILDFFSGGLFSKNRKKYKGITVEKHFKGQEFKNDFGECYVISDKAIIKTLSTDNEIVKQKLLSDLKVISGISDITETNLRKSGINSVLELTKHCRYGNEALSYSNAVEEKNAAKIYDQLSKRFTSSNPLLLLTSSFFDISEIAFIDIETMGLHNCPLFLIGIATVKENELIINQILLRDLKEEKSALHFLSQHLLGKRAICSFNGKSFDLPFIRKRMERHDIKHEIAHPHFDIKYFSSKAFGEIVLNCRLVTLEKELFQIKRMEDIPSSYVPYFYSSYIRTKNIGSIIPIIDHNKQDLISTVNIFMKLHEIWS